MTVGVRLRIARRARGLSLQEAAGQLGVSAATLSRIETEKQRLDMQMFLELCRILDRNPVDLLPSTHDADDALATLIEGSGHDDRMRLWKQLTLRYRNEGSSRGSAGDLLREVDELLAQIDFVRAEVESVRRRLVARADRGQHRVIKPPSTSE